jgi:hypothetical protein
MRFGALAALAALPLCLASPPDALARGGTASKAVPAPLVTPGTSWTFDVTARQPDGSTESWVEVWTINSVDPEGKVKRLWIDIEKPEGGGDLPETSVDYLLEGGKLYDMYTLDRLRSPGSREPSVVLKTTPLIDFAKVSTKPTVTRIGMDPKKYVRFQKRDKAEVGGKELRDVIEATHARGETDSTETWWFDAKKGLVAMRTEMPVVGGGTVFTWVAR